MKLLIDTNIVIPMEPASTADVEAGSATAREFHRLAGKAGYELFVHPLIRLDIEHDQNTARAELRKQLLGKYSTLNNPPTIIQRPLPPLETPDQTSNDWVDVNLLVALSANAVDVLVTDDENIHKKAARVGLQSRVVRLPDIVASLKDLFDQVHEPPPAVEFIEAYSLNEQDKIFDSLREGYGAEFDPWLQKCKTQHRHCYVIRDKDANKYVGVSILNREDEAYGLPGKVLKLCTFKIAEEYGGYRYGELLLKAVFEYAVKNQYNTVFVTAHPDKERLIQTLQSFGFQIILTGVQVVLIKRFTYTQAEYEAVDPLGFHVLYGPMAAKFVGNDTHIVPILPEFHKLLFPEYEPQPDLFPGQHPCGNSIKKAYLCHSATRQLKAGDNLLFYRSDDEKAVTAVGIVEDYISSSSAEKVGQYVSTRTVYSFEEIKAMCQTETLAIKFRLVKIIKPTIPLKDLKKNKVVKEHPQAIQKIKNGSAEWIEKATQLQPTF
jgi:ribosomal protein S18 acetylase RimI-like enzyme